MTHGDVNDVIKFFREQSYNGVFVCGNRTLPVSVFDPGIHQREEGERFWDAPGYCNNFIMRKDVE